jgi:hypothetical protein
MAQPVCKFWMMKYKEAWYALSPDEQKALMAKNMESQKQVGCETILTQVSLWSDEKWLAWGVEKYPSVEAMQQHALNLFNMNWYRYIEAKSCLGMDMPQM